MEDSAMYRKPLLPLQEVTRSVSSLVKSTTGVARIPCPISFSDVAPTVAPQLPGICPESTKQKTWLPFRGYCYTFLNSLTVNWAQASVDCLKMGMES